LSLVPSTAPVIVATMLALRLASIIEQPYLERINPEILLQPAVKRVGN
jgi:hypothetical protein